MEEERIGLFLDFENLAIGAREQLGGTFDFKPIADALAERGRVVVRRAYADWSMFDDARRELTRHHIELIEIPQKMGVVRKNAADIKLAVDAIEVCLERDYITTFVIGTGDSDFTPLVHKLRELNKRVIGIGIGASTSSLLPPACDEFLFYERLQGVEASSSRATPRRGSGGSSSRRRGPVAVADGEGDATPAPRTTDLETLDRLITQTLSGLKRRAGDVVLASSLKRTLLRKDPTFDESAYGFRSLGELLRNLAERNVIKLNTGSAPGDPEVDFPDGVSGGSDDEAFELLRDVITEMGEQHLPGLKNKLRRRRRDFSEKKYGYGGFLQFCKAAQARGYIDMNWSDESGDYVVCLPGTQTAEASAREPASGDAPATPLFGKPAVAVANDVEKSGIEEPVASDPEPAAPKPKARTRKPAARKTSARKSTAKAPSDDGEKPKRAPTRRKSASPAKRAPRSKPSS
jgi:uncharacterized LabA/DUF88 family protein